MSGKLFNKFRNISITLKFAFFYILTFIFLIFTSYLTINFFKADKINSANISVERLQQQLSNSFDNTFDALSSLTKTPYASDLAENSLLLKEWNRFNNGTYSLELHHELKSLFALLKSCNPNIDSIYLYNTNGDYIFQSKEVLISSDTLLNKQHEQLLQNTYSANGSPFISGQHYLPYETDLLHNPVSVFSVSRVIRSLSNGETLGILSVNIHSSFFEQLIAQATIDPEQVSLLLDENNKIIASHNLNHSPLEDSALLADAIESNQDNYLYINDSQYLINQCNLQSTAWKLITMLPTKSLYSNIQYAQNRLLFINLFILIIFLLFQITFSNLAIKPLSNLMLLAQEVEKGNFNVQAKVRNHDEIGKLSLSFNHMTQQLKTLIDEKYVNTIIQKDLELQMLQSQINPHFLYNTLESIHMMAEINDDHETSNMVQALGSLMRYSISNPYATVTLAEELSSLKDYIFLQNIRFDDMFHFELEIEPDTLSIKVNKLLLQPLVENAIYHAFSQTTESGKIIISSYTENNYLYLKVVDNGTGIDPEKLKLLNEYIQNGNQYFDSIALKNLSRRLQLNYGPNASIFLYNNSNTGTTSLIKIPLP